MKSLILLCLSFAIMWNAGAQDTTRVKGTEKEIVTVKDDSTRTVVKVGEKDVVTVTEDSTGTVVKVGDGGIIVVEDQYDGDTLKIRIGNRTIKVVDSEGKTSVKTSREPVEKRKTTENSTAIGEVWNWGSIPFTPVIIRCTKPPLTREMISST